ncbi:MAG: TolC family protein, partial [Rhodospirillales bacterium]
MSQRQRSGVAVGVGFLLVAALFLGGPPARALTLDEILPELLDTHNQVKAAEDDLFAARERARVALGGWYPTLNVSGNFGRERQWKPEAKDTNLLPHEADFTLTQRLWDFDATNSAVRSARLTVEQMQMALGAVRQQILLQGITAFLNVRRAVEVLAFSRQSESNIKKQSELENAMVERGAGLATDVLQAKVQLAGASARRVRDEGALQVA